MTTDDRPIDYLDLSVVAYSCLMRHGIKTIGDLKRLSDEDLCRIRNLSQTRIAEIKEKLSACSCEELVSVVRCKDCKHFHELGSYALGEGSCWQGFLSPKTVKHNDFCSYGERKEE